MILNYSESHCAPEPYCVAVLPVVVITSTATWCDGALMVWPHHSTPPDTKNYNLTDIYCDGPVSRDLRCWWCEARDEYLVQIAAVSPISDQPVEPHTVPGEADGGGGGVDSVCRVAGVLLQCHSVSQSVSLCT